MRVRDQRPTPTTDKLVAEMKGRKQQALAINLAYLCRKLEREARQLRAAGSQLSNIAFNWAQDTNRTWQDRQMLDECRKLWDTAAHCKRRKYNLPTPKS